MVEAANHGLDLIMVLVMRLLPAITVGVVMLKFIPRSESLARSFIHTGIFAVVIVCFLELKQ
jgi:hypothetical protein